MSSLRFIAIRIVMETDIILCKKNHVFGSSFSKLLSSEIRNESVQCTQCSRAIIRPFDAITLMNRNLLEKQKWERTGWREREMTFKKFHATNVDDAQVRTSYVHSILHHNYYYYLSADEKWISFLPNVIFVNSRNERQFWMQCDTKDEMRWDECTLYTQRNEMIIIINIRWYCFCYRHCAVICFHFMFSRSRSHLFLFSLHSHVEWSADARRVFIFSFSFTCSISSMR